MAPQPQSTDGAAQLQPRSIEGVFPSGEIEALLSSAQPPESKEPYAEMNNSVETVNSTEVNMSTAAMEKHSQMENCEKKSNGEIEASKIKQSPENASKIKKFTGVGKIAGMEKHCKMEKSAEMEKLVPETGDLIDRLDPSGVISIMCLASPLYAVLAVWPLWRVADQPEAFLWTFAHLACFYLFLWIITLSTTSVSTVFFRITYVLMLAFTVVHLIGPMNGMVFLYTGMIYVAGMLGYAVAEHLQHAGFEQTAHVLCSSTFVDKDFEEHVALMHFVTIVMSLPILARTAWVILVPYSGHITCAHVERVVIELTGEIFFLAVLWILYITEFILRGALVSMGRFVRDAFICWIACYALSMLCSFNIAVAVGMLVMWLGWMAIGGFFGYCLAVRAFYCKMLTRIESTPAAKEERRNMVIPHQ